jgi:hypothetical protein
VQRSGPRNHVEDYFGSLSTGSARWPDAPGPGTTPRSKTVILYAYGFTWDERVG